MNTPDYKAHDLYISEVMYLDGGYCSYQQSQMKKMTRIFLNLNCYLSNTQSFELIK